MSNVEQKRRELFEVWVQYRQYLKRNKDGSYNEEWVDARWIGFNAALDAVEIVLPSPLTAPPYASYEGGWNDMRDEATDAIESTNLGLKVK